MFSYLKKKRNWRKKKAAALESIAVKQVVLTGRKTQAPPQRKKAVPTKTYLVLPDRDRLYEQARDTLHSQQPRLTSPFIQRSRFVEIVYS